MRETWLHPNRRAIWFGCVPPLIAGAIGVAMLLLATDSQQAAWRWSGAALTIVAAVLLAMLLRQLRRPRIAYRDGRVLFYLRAGRPIDIPADVVEAFFLGRGPANLPAGAATQQQTINLVARLAQRRTEWANRAVKPALGDWRDGYVTIRGTWCEPLGPELVRRLNRRLKEVKSQGFSPTGS